MTKWRPVLVAIAIVLLGMFYVRACWEPSIRADERRRAVDRGDDSALARMAARELERDRAHQRERDSLRAVIAKKRSAVRTVYVHDTLGTDTLYVRAPVDSLVAALDARHRADSLETLFWKAQVAARDSIIPRLQQARDSYRREAAKPRHTVTDIAGSSLATYGLLKENEIAAAAGGLLILGPRVVDLIGRVF